MKNSGKIRDSKCMTRNRPSLLSSKRRRKRRKEARRGRSPRERMMPLFQSLIRRRFTRTLTKKIILLIFLMRLRTTSTTISIFLFLKIQLKSE